MDLLQKFNTPRATITTILYFIFFPEGLATGQLDTGISWFPCVFFLVSLCLQANAETVPQFPSCYYMPLM
jgi:hypothetical protein